MRDKALDKVPASGLNLVYVIGTYPSLTKTFIDREVNSLRDLGASVQVVAARRSLGLLSPEQKEAERDVLYLFPASILPVIASHLRFALRRPVAYSGTLLYLVTRPHASLRARLKTIGHFGAGVYAAHLLGKRPCDHIHAHFVDRAATLALVMSRLLGVHYSITAHANDIYVSPVLLPEKMSKAKFVATCTRYNQTYLARVAGGDGSERSGLSEKVRCVYHGLDLAAYRSGGATRSTTPVLLSVGQLKEKKGFAHLARACRVLRDQGYRFRVEIVGEGPLRPELERLIRELSLEDTISLTGALPHQEVIRRYERSHIFVLPCVLGGDGDRDGIPNVVLEAMAMQLPVVSTDISGIPEVLEDGVNGLLIPPADHFALAGALGRLLDDPELRSQMGERGRAKIAAEFDVEQNARRLLHEFARSA